MSRPETIADLPDDVRRGNRAFDGNLFEFQNTPAVISAWGHLLEVATAAGFTLDEGTVYRPPTVSELEARLTEHQRAWDSNEGQYLAARGGAPEPQYAWALKQWCRAEGLDYPYAETVSV